MSARKPAVFAYASPFVASAIGVLLAACGGAAKAPTSPSTSPSGHGHDDALAGMSASARPGLGKVIPGADVPPKIAMLTDKILRRASIARHLDIMAPVKLDVLSGAQLVDLVKKQVADDVPRDVVTAEGDALAVLGLIPWDYDYENESYALLEEQLAGLYLPSNKTMYLASGLDDDEIDGTLAHELVHALQDQHFDLGSRMKYRPASSDSLGALQALAEGDATSAMLDEMILSRGGPDALSRHSAIEADDQDPEDMVAPATSGTGKHRADRLAHAPRFIAVGLLAPYADGLRFVNGLRRRGGWPSVDAAWARPPISGEQLLHLDKYDVAEPSVIVPTPTATALGSSWQRKFDDVLGEEEGRVAFAEWMGVAQSKEAASGWGGDHVALFVDSADPNRRAVAWTITFDGPSDAADAYAQLSKGWEGRFGLSPSTSPQQPGVALAIFNGAPTAARASKAEKKRAATATSGGLPTLPDSSTPTSTPRDRDSAATASSSKGALPALPDETSSTTTSTVAKTVRPKPPTSCRALRLSGRTIAIVAGAPCASAATWSAEVGKAP